MARMARWLLISALLALTACSGSDGDTMNAQAYCESVALAACERSNACGAQLDCSDWQTPDMLEWVVPCCRAFVPDGTACNMGFASITECTDAINALSCTRLDDVALACYP